MTMLICGIFKNGTSDPIYKAEIESQMQITNLRLPREKGAGINWEIGMNIYTLLYLKQITNRNLLYSMGNSTEYSLTIYQEQNLKKSEYMYMYN